jgi:hypothetical protein
MRKLSNAVLVSLLASIPVAVGCSSDTPAASGTGSGGKSGGTTGTGGTSSSTEQGVVLNVNATGGYDTDMTLGVMGAWYPYGDSTACVAAGHAAADCSMIMTPPAAGFAGVTGNKLCTSGTAAKVLNGTDGMPDYTNMWGTGIGLDLNNSGGANGKMPYNATGKVTGVAFEIDTPPLAGLRVELPTPATTNGAAYWGGKSSNTSPVVAGHNSFKWADVTGPMYATNPPAFDPTMILSIQFHVPTNTSAVAPFNYCISNLKLLTN